MINDFIDKIYCVNLDRRTDKWELCEKEFIKHSLTVERFSAIDGNTVKYEGRLMKGVVGDAMSQAQIVRIARLNQLDNVMILEDDVEFAEGLQDKFEAWRVQVPDDWQLLYFGGNHNNRDHNGNATPIPLCASNLARITNTYTTHAYVIKSSLFDLVIERLEALTSEIDVTMAEIQKVSNAYCFVPNLATQRAGVSDIHNVWVDYSFLRK